MRTLLKYLTLWIPFMYAMAIGGIALYGWSRSTISWPPGLSSFVAFLPMAFLFSAISTQNRLSELEKRIATLEKQAGPKTDEISNS